MWELHTPWYDLVLRAVSVYLFMFILMRVWGRKHLGQVTPFDFILLLFISESVQNAIVDDDKSVTGAFIVILTFLSLNTVVNRLTFRFPVLERILSGKPKVIVEDGKIIEKVKHREYISDQELQTALREEGIEDLSKVKKATVETNGRISVVQNQ